MQRFPAIRREVEAHLFFRGTSYLAGAYLLSKSAIPLGWLSVIEEGLRTINERRWRDKKQSLTRRPCR